MKFILLSLAIAGCCVLVSCKPREAAGPAGSAAPKTTNRLELERIDGRGTISLSDYTGKSLLAVFYGPWTDSAQDMNRMIKALEPTGLTVLPVVMDRTGGSAGAPGLEVSGQILPAVKANDQLMAIAGEIRALPTTVLLGPDGKVRQQWSGHVAASNIVAAVLAPAPVEPAGN